MLAGLSSEAIRHPVVDNDLGIRQAACSQCPIGTLIQMHEGYRFHPIHNPPHPATACRLVHLDSGTDSLFRGSSDTLQPVLLAKWPLALNTRRSLDWQQYRRLLGSVGREAFMDAHQTPC